MAVKKPLVIPVLDLYHALRSVKDGACSDRTRPHISCVHFCSVSANQTPKGEDGRLDIVATNGHVIYIWRQRLEGAPNRAFSIPLRPVTRLVREVTDVRREFLDAQKKWNRDYSWKKGDKPPMPEEPGLHFFEDTYHHPLGKMRLDTINEKYVPYEKISGRFKPRLGAPPPATGISSSYLAEVCKNLQKATGNKNAPIRMEFDTSPTAGDANMALMRFTVAKGPINDLRSRHLTCFVMPMVL